MALRAQSPPFIAVQANTRASLFSKRACPELGARCHTYGAVRPTHADIFDLAGGGRVYRRFYLVAAGSLYIGPRYRLSRGILADSAQDRQSIW